MFYRLDNVLWKEHVKRLCTFLLNVLFCRCHFGSIVLKCYPCLLFPCCCCSVHYWSIQLSLNRLFLHFCQCLLQVFWCFFIRGWYVYNFYFYYWPFFVMKSFLYLSKIFCFKIYFGINKYSSFLMITVHMIYLFPSFYFKSPVDNI